VNRRQWLKAAGAAGIMTALPNPLPAASAQHAASKASAINMATVNLSIKRLQLRHTWTTTMSSSTYRETVHLAYTRDGITGYGEGAPIIRYEEYPAQAKLALEAIADKIAAGDPARFDSFLADIRRQLGEHQHAAMAAVDIAVMDWVGKKLNLPLYQYFGLDPADAPVTTFSIGIDTPEITKQKTLEAAPYPVCPASVGNGERVRPLR
jgi:L-alanine-DL-glutamate epimerase-like enolase superfamily enzyme